MPLKKRIIAFVVSLAMCASFVPVLALADVVGGEESDDVENGAEMTAQATGVSIEIHNAAGDPAGDGTFTYEGGTAVVKYGDAAMTSKSVNNVECSNIAITPAPKEGYTASVQINGAAAIPVAAGSTYNYPVASNNAVVTIDILFAQNSPEPQPQGDKPITVKATATGQGGFGEIAVNGTGFMNGADPTQTVNATRNVGRETGVNTVSVSAEFAMKFESLTINGVPCEPTNENQDQFVGDIKTTDGTYVVDAVIVPNTFTTLVWADEPGAFGEDAVVGHGTVSIDEAPGIVNMAQPGDKGGFYAIEKGRQVTIHIVPEYGYQLETALLNDVPLTPDNDEVGTYTFTMSQAPLHLAALFTPVANNVVAASDSVSGGSIAGADGIVDSGTLQLTISDMNDAAKQTAMSAQVTDAGDAVQMYLDLDLAQVVNKGTTIAAGTAATNENAWVDNTSDGVHNLAHAVTVTLAISPELAATGGPFYVVREHDGVHERIECVLDQQNNTISFTTDKFSDYMLVKDNKAATKATSKTTTAKTGDSLPIGGVAVLALVALGGIAFASRRSGVRG